MRYRVDRWDAGPGGAATAGRREAGSITDFLTYQQTNGAFASAWGEIQGQLNLEGAGQTELDAAKNAFTDAYNQLPSLGFDGQDVIDKAKQFVLVGKTIAGQLGTVEGLIASAQNPQQGLAFTQAFTGTLISAAMAAGVLSAGIGAAVVGAVAVGVDLLKSTGLFGGGNVPSTIPGCAWATCGSTPADFVVGCLCAHASSGQAVVSPGAGNWRTFPSRSNPGDAAWYARCFWNCADFDWKGVTWRNDFFCNTNQCGIPRDITPIDYAFGSIGGENPTATFAAGYGLGPVWDGTDLADPTQPPAGFFSPGLPAGFQAAWVKAWIGNAEYALNGLKPQPNEQVLIHLVRMWNRTHELGTPIPFDHNSIIGQFAANAFNAIGLNDPIAYRGTRTLFVNGGPAKNVGVVGPSMGFSSASSVAAIFAKMAAERARAQAAAPSPVKTVATLGALGLGAALLLKPALVKGLLAKIGLAL